MWLDIIVIGSLIWQIYIVGWFLMHIERQLINLWTLLKEVRIYIGIMI